MEASKQIARVLIALLVFGTALAAVAQPASAQNPVPALSLTISPGERQAQITASQPAAVQFFGNYTVDKLSFERAVVTFIAVVSTGWAVTVSPASITVSGNAGRTGSIIVTVVVPAGTLAVDIGQLTVTGRAIAGGLQSAPAQAQGVITPQPYFRTIASSTNPFIESPYSSQVVISYKIWNEGNVRDQVRVNIKNLEDLSTEQWVIVMSRQSFTIEPTFSQDIQVTVGLPKAWQFVSDNKVKVIELEASSGEGAANGQPYADMLPVFIRTVGFSMPGFDLPLALLGTVVAAMIAGAAHQRPRRRIVK